MGIFNKKRWPIYTADELDNVITDDPANFEQVLYYLVGLSADDFKKVIKCANIARKSKADQLSVLGKENKPTTFIEPPAPPVVADGNFHDLYDTDTKLGNFLEDEPIKNKKGKKSNVK